MSFYGRSQQKRKQQESVKFLADGMIDMDNGLGQVNQ